MVTAAFALRCGDTSYTPTPQIALSLSHYSSRFDTAPAFSDPRPSTVDTVSRCDSLTCGVALPSVP